MVDPGTGSGAIGVTPALEKPHWQVALVDLSEAALQVATDNARQLNAPVQQVRPQLAVPCEEPDLIVSNLPYIDASDHHLDEGDVRFELPRRWKGR